MENHVGKTCPFCKTTITESDAVRVCPACDIPHHESCWIENHGCTTFGCSQRYPDQPQTPALAVRACANCHSALPDGTDFCPACGTPAPAAPAPTPVATQNTVCTNCHATLPDGIAFCPACGTPAPVQMVVCISCQTVLPDGAPFCPTCGTASPITPKKNVCGHCGAELQGEQALCPACGYKADAVVDTSSNDAIHQFNANLQKKKKSPVILIVVIAVLAIIGTIIGVVVSNSIAAQRAEEAKEEYIENVEDFLKLSYTAASNLEDIADTIQEYWHDNIWYDMWGDDIDGAIVFAMLARADEIDQAEYYDTRLKNLYSKIKKVPDEVNDKDEDDLEDLREAVQELYDVYTDFYTLATDPSGNYNSYSASNNSTTNEFLSCHSALKKLLD